MYHVHADHKKRPELRSLSRRLPRYAYGFLIHSLRMRSAPGTPRNSPPGTRSQAGRCVACCAAFDSCFGGRAAASQASSRSHHGQCSGLAPSGSAAPSAASMLRGCVGPGSSAPCAPRAVALLVVATAFACWQLSTVFSAQLKSCSFDSCSWLRRRGGDFNATGETLVHRACAPVQQYCGHEGRECGDAAIIDAAHAAALNALLSRNATVRAVVFGNSVARTHGFGTTRLWIEAIEATSPVRIDVVYGSVNGGFELKHVVRGDALPAIIGSSELVIVQYLYSKRRWLGRFLREVSRLPHAPVVVLIKACCMGDFSSRSEWRTHPMRTMIGEPDGFYEPVRVDESDVAAAFGVPVVDTCVAFRELLRTKKMADAVDVMNVLIPDAVHQSLVGSMLQACLLARLTSNAVPPAVYDDNATSMVDDGHVERFVQNVWSPNSTLASKVQRLVPSALVGWRLMRGGRGGTKQWYAPFNGVGSTITIRTMPCRFLYVSVYTHHDLPLALVRATVRSAKTGMIHTQLIDPCCAHPHCDGVGLGRGMYKDVRVPPLGQQFDCDCTSSNMSFELSLTIVRRRTPGVCAKNGTQFSLISIVGMIERPD